MGKRVIEESLDKTVIELGKRTYTLIVRPFGAEIDVEELLTVQMNDIILDIITFPVVFNRISNMKAEVDSLYSEAQLDFKVFEAEMYKYHKGNLIKMNEKATEGTVDAEIKTDPRYKSKGLHVISIKKAADVIDGLYWSAKSKDQKLNSISAKIKPEEFEIDILRGAAERVFNSVQVRASIFNR